MSIEQLILIDSRVQGWEALVKALPDTSTWRLLDPQQDAAGQVLAAATEVQGQGLRSIHIVSHGAAGSLFIGDGVLNRHTVQQQAPIWARIGEQLEPQGTLLLYGCEVGRSEEGRGLLELLASLTGAVVAASSDPTGNRGDWFLEVSTGPLAVSLLEPSGYAGTLGTSPVLNAAVAPSAGSVSEGETSPAGVSIAQMVVGNSITDVDGAIEAVAIERVNTALGNWQYKLSGTSVWLTVDPASLNSTTNALGLLLGPDDSIRLLPFGDLQGLLPDALTFRAWDMSTGSAGQYVVTTPGSGAFSADSDTASVIVAAVNDAPTFAPRAGGGKTLMATTAGLAGHDTLVQPDGKIVVVGRNSGSASGDNFGIFRWNPDGSPDATFGSGTGRLSVAVSTTAADTGYQAALQPDGKIVVAGYVFNGANNDFCIVRISSNGSLDTSFGGTGKVTVGVSTIDDVGRGLVVQPDGKIVVAGYSDASKNQFSLIRLLANGSLDKSFGETGKVLLTVSSTVDRGSAIALQPDGKIIVVGQVFGSADFDFGVVRLNADGSLDNSFGTGGKLSLPVGEADDWCRDVVVQPDGKILLVGSSDNGGAEAFSVVRLTAEGALDITFGAGGQVVLAVGGTEDRAQTGLLQPDGRIILAGASRNGTTGMDFGLVRLNANGSLDTTFAGTGKLVLPVSVAEDTAYGLAFQPDGRLVVAGTSANAVSVARLNADGSVDTSFAGTATETLGGTASYVENASPVALDPEVRVFDADLVPGGESSGHYAGSTLRLSRESGAHPDDVFSTTAGVSLVSPLVPVGPGEVLVSGVGAVGQYFRSGGWLEIRFSEAATQKVVNQVLSSIAYANASNAPPETVRIAWTFTDQDAGAGLWAGHIQAPNIDQGAEGPLSASGITTVQVSRVDDPGSVFIQGTATVGQLLTAVAQDPDGIAGAVVYQWYAGGESIEGAQQATLALNAQHTGLPITVTASYTDEGGRSESPTSEPTALVAPAPYVPQTPVLDTSKTPQLGTVVQGVLEAAGVSVAQMVADGSISGTGSAVAPEAVVVTGVLSTLGTWQFSLDDGASWLSIRSDLLADETVEWGLVLGPAARLRLVPFGEVAGTHESALSFRAWDPSGGGQGSYQVVRDPGQTSSAFSAASDTAAITILPPPDLNAPPTFLVEAGGGLTTIPVSAIQDEARAVLIQPDGSILLAGQAWRSFQTDNALVAGDDWAVVRLKPDGTADPSFGSDGVAWLDFRGLDDSAHAMVLEPDGKLLVAGNIAGWLPNASLRGSFVGVARFNPDGSLDSGFASGGTLEIGSLTDIKSVESIAVQADGKVVLAGPRGGSAGGTLMRLNPDGSVDTGFGLQGHVSVTVFGLSGGYPKELPLHPQVVGLSGDGTILVAGYMEPELDQKTMVLVRLRGDGSLDDSFGAGGLVQLGVAGEARDLAVLPDGSVVVAGGQGFWTLAKVDKSGQADSSFGSFGLLQVDVGAGPGEVRKVLVQPDGKILLGGFTSDGNQTDLAVVRLTSTGAVDPSFGINGLAIAAPALQDLSAQPVDHRAWSMTLAPDGHILLAGASGSDLSSSFAVARLNPDGSFDTSLAPEKVDSLAGPVTYVEGAPAVLLDGSVQVIDPDLGALSSGAGNYAGSTVRLARAGGADTHDVFSPLGSLAFVSGKAELAGLAVGDVTQANGELRITFNGEATQDRVNGVLSSLGYLNTSDTPPAAVEIAWLFDDGNQGAQGAGAALAVERYKSVTILPTNDAPQLGLAAGLGANGHEPPPATYREGDPAVVLSPSAQVLDPELAAQGHYDGAVLQLIRVGGPDARDRFSGSGIVPGQARGTVVVQGVPVGDYAYAEGGLLITFGHQATQARVDEVLGSLAYTYAGDAPPPEVQIAWRFGDGNRGAQGSGGILEDARLATVQLTSVDDPGAVSIEGQAIVGRPLTARVKDPDGLSGPVSYQWYAGGQPISGADGESFIVKAQHVGQAIHVEAAYTDAGGTVERPVSALTQAVLTPPPSAQTPSQVTERLNFKATDLSMWGPGQAAVDQTWEWWAINERLRMSPRVGVDFGFAGGSIGLDASVDVKLGLQAKLSGTTGDVDLDYGYVAEAFLPELAYAGSVVEINTAAWTDHRSIVTTGPKFAFDLGLAYQFDTSWALTYDYHWGWRPYFGGSGNGTILSINAGTGGTKTLPIVHLGFNPDAVDTADDYFSLEIFDWEKRLPGDAALSVEDWLGLPITGRLGLPRGVNTARSSSEWAPAANASIDSYAHSPPFFTFGVDVDQVVGYFFGVDTSKLEGEVELPFNLGSQSYQLFDVDLTAQVSLAQNFTFVPNVILAEITSSLGEVQTKPLGESFYFETPASGEGLMNFNTKYYLSGSLVNQTGLHGALVLDLDMLNFSGHFDWSLLDEQRTLFQGDTYVFEKNIPVNFAAQTGGFEIPYAEGLARGSGTNQQVLGADNAIAFDLSSNSDLIVKLAGLDSVVEVTLRSKDALGGKGWSLVESNWEPATNAAGVTQRFTTDLSFSVADMPSGHYELHVAEQKATSLWARVGDSGGAGFKIEYELARTNHAPVFQGLGTSIPVTENSTFAYHYGAQFFDADEALGDSLLITVGPAPGSTLPAWVQVDPHERVLTINPPTGAPDLPLRLVAIDEGGKQTAVALTIDTPQAKDDAGNSLDTAKQLGALSIGSIGEAFLDYLGEDDDPIDVYGFDIEGSATLSVDIPASIDWLDVSVRKADGTVLSHSQHEAGTGRELLVAKDLPAGSYFLQVEASKGHGDYALAMSVSSLDKGGSLQSPAIVQMVQGSHALRFSDFLDPQDPEDRYQLDLEGRAWVSVSGLDNLGDQGWHGSFGGNGGGTFTTDMVWSDGMFGSSPFWTGVLQPGPVFITLMPDKWVRHYEVWVPGVFTSRYETRSEVMTYSGVASAHMVYDRLPALSQEAQDRTLTIGASFEFSLGQLFTDPDGDAVESAVATLADGSALPAWLRFDPASLSFSGRVEQDFQPFEVKVVAVFAGPAPDAGMRTVSDTFALNATLSDEVGNDQTVATTIPLADARGVMSVTSSDGVDVFEFHVTDPGPIAVLTKGLSSGTLLSIVDDKGQALRSVEAPASVGTGLITESLPSGRYFIQTKSDPVPDGYLVVIDATYLVQPVQAPVLAPGQDTGSSASDLLTRVQTPALEGAAAPGTQLLMLDGETVVAEFQVGAEGSWRLTLPALADGAHELRLRVRDAVGNLSVPSAALHLAVDTQAPLQVQAPELAMMPAPSDSTPVPVALNGLAEAGSKVQVRSGQNLLGEVEADGSGKWHFVLPELEDGPQVLTTTVIDAAGNESEAQEVTFAAVNVSVGEFDDNHPQAMVGSPRINLVTFASTPVGVHADLAQGRLLDTGLGTVALLSIEGLRGSPLGDRLVGDVAGNYLDGSEGADTLIGGDGNDTLVGGAGADSMQGGAGDDTYLVDAPDDITLESTHADGGVDSVISSVSHTLGNHLENLQLVGAATNGQGNEADNLLEGNEKSNMLHGASGSDTLQGREGDDFLDGGAGTDSLLGGAGNDTLEGGEGLDVALFEGARSAYTISWAAATSALTVSAAGEGTDTLTGVETLQFEDGSFAAETFQTSPAGPSLQLQVYTWKSHQMLAGVLLAAGGRTASTDDQGQAELEDLLGSSITVEVNLEATITEQVSMNSAVRLQDALAILRMIMGLPVNAANQPLSPYQIYAADFDGNGVVNLNDAIGVLRHVVELDAPKPQWVFFDEASAEVAALKGLSPGALPPIQVNLDGVGTVSKGLVAVLRGDVDGSYGTSLAGTERLEEVFPEYFQDPANEASINPAEFGIYGP